MVGYDPRRDVATNGDAFGNVRDAVAKYGHAGVKLYPPMGFAAYGNTTPSHDCDWPDEENYGTRIDERLAALYTWCVVNEVPLIAHSSESMGISKDCQHNGGPDDWKAALSRWDGLRV